MSTNFQIYGRIAGRIDDQLVDAGSLEIPTSLSVAGKVHRRVEQIANSANSVLFSNELSGFELLYLAADMNTRALLTDSADNTMSLRLRGTGVSGKYGVPFILGLDETSNASTKLTSVRVYNTSGSTAKVLCVAVK